MLFVGGLIWTTSQSEFIGTTIFSSVSKGTTTGVSRPSLYSNPLIVGSGESKSILMLDSLLEIEKIYSCFTLILSQFKCGHHTEH